MQKRKSNKNEDDWRIFSYSFLLLAKLACQELLDKRTNKHSKTTEYGPPEFSLPYTSPDLFISILFNVKHGIEVIIKTISVFALGEYEEGHDIHILFQEVKRKISGLNLKPALDNKWDKITPEDIANLPDNLDKMESLINEFYTMDILKPKLEKNFYLRDVKNDIFRYPDNKASVQIDWGALLDGKINEVDIKNILNIIDQFYNLFGKTGYFFSVLSKNK